MAQTIDCLQIEKLPDDKKEARKLRGRKYGIDNFYRNSIKRIYKTPLKCVTKERA